MSKKKKDPAFIPVTRQRFVIGDMVKLLNGNEIGIVVEVWENRNVNKFAVHWLERNCVTQTDSFWLVGVDFKNTTSMSVSNG